MSLVDSGYGSDDDEDVLAPEETDTEHQSTTQPRGDEFRSASCAAPSPASSVADGQAEGATLRQGADLPSGPSTPVLLPDVSDLFGSNVSIASTTADTARKRRAVNGSGHSMPHNKLPRGNLQPSRVPPDTAGGLLTPPQLRGRSNVATEDLDKIFSRRQGR